MMLMQNKYVLALDEIFTREYLEDNASFDVIPDFQDLLCFGVSKSPTKNSMVIMNRGFYSHWKIVETF